MDGTEAIDDPALELYLAELNERLVVHWAGGAWRVPLATRHLAVATTAGRPLGRIVCAGPGDAARALAGLRPGPAIAPETLDRLLAPFAALMARLRALEGYPGDLWDPIRASRALSATRDTDRRAVLLSAADRPVSELVGTLAGLAVRGAVWKPAPRAAASAHLAMRALAPVLGPSLALVQGDHDSGAALVAIGDARPVWARQRPDPATPAVPPS